MTQPESSAMTEPQTVEQTEAERIAKSLTKAQAALLLADNPWFSIGYSPGAKLEVLGLLVRREYGFGSIVKRTRFGEQVRAILSHPDNEKDEG